MIKKIAIITRNMLGGGAERVIAQLIKYFDNINIECILITIDDEEIFYELPYKTNIVAIGEKSSNKIKDRILRYIDVRNIVKKTNPDIVLSMPEDIGIYVIPALLGTGIPLVISERNNPWIMPDVKVTRGLRKVFYHFVDGFIFQTEMAASFFSKSIQNKGIILPNPLEVERLPEKYIGERRKEVVAAGRLTEQKNFKLLIEAFSEFYKSNNDYKLIIYGEGRLRDELVNMASEKMPSSAFLFPGITKDLLEKINGASMFILSSSYEGVPNVLIEAMAMGMPVIATDCPSGGPKMLISNEENGLLVPVNNKYALIEAMEKLKDNAFAEEMGNNALVLRKKLGSKIIYEKWINYLNEIIEK